MGLNGVNFKKMVVLNKVIGIKAFSWQWGDYSCSNFQMIVEAKKKYANVTPEAILLYLRAVSFPM